MSIQVTIRFPNGNVQTYTFEKNKIFIGRRDGNDIKLPFPYVSGRHVMIQAGAGKFYAQDLGSTNGTLLNGTQLSPHELVPLRESDMIQIGPLEIFVETIQEATIIEQVPDEFVEDQAQKIPDHPRLRKDEVATMWELQTGYSGAFRVGGAGIEVDDRKVDVIRGMDQVTAPRQSPEQRILGNISEPEFSTSSSFTLPAGVVYQIVGFAIIIVSIVFLLLILFA